MPRPARASVPALLPVFIVVLVAAVARAPTPRASSPARSRPPGALPARSRSASPPVRTFALAIGTGDLDGDLAARYRGYDLLVVDGEEASPAQIAALHRSGARVLGYLSIGTIEPGRSWYRRARRYRLDFWPDFGEFYADTSKSGYRRLMLAVAAGQAAKGFDGVFLDNVDMIVSHRHQAAGMLALVSRLSRMEHARAKLVFAQNGAEIMAPYIRLLDGWNREDVTSTYDFAHRRYRGVPPADQAQADGELARMRAAGLIVTATDYVADGDQATLEAARANACRVGAVPFVSNIALTRIPAAQPCP